MLCVFSPVIQLDTVYCGLPADFYMIDYSDKTIKTGELIQFHNMPKSVRLFLENERVIKIVAGVGGDKRKSNNGWGL